MGRGDTWAMQPGPWTEREEGWQRSPARYLCYRGPDESLVVGYPCRPRLAVFLPRIAAAMARLLPLLPTPPASVRCLLLLIVLLLSDAASIYPRSPVSLPLLQLKLRSADAAAEPRAPKLHRPLEPPRPAAQGILHRHVSLYSASRRQEPNPPPSSRGRAGRSPPPSSQNRSQEPPSKFRPRARSPPSTSIDLRSTNSVKASTVQCKLTAM